MLHALCNFEKQTILRIGQLELWMDVLCSVVNSSDQILESSGYLCHVVVLVHYIYLLCLQHYMRKDSNVIKCNCNE
jgi:hypothetical protein